MYRPILLSALLIVLTACGSRTVVDPTPFELAVVHINDHHSSLAARQLTLTLAGEDIQVEAGGFPRVITQIRQLSAAYPNSLKLHAGDAITGDIYYSLFKSKADADFMNQLCFDAFVLGNHEFDDSDANLKQFLDQLAAGPCNTAILSANVIPEIGTPLAPDHHWQSFKPYTIKQFGAHRVGIIGLTIAQKTSQSSNPLSSTAFLDETETARRYIAELKKQGIGKIILLTHYDYKNDLKLATVLPEVDLIVGGDSHSLLGDFASVGLPPDGPYPTRLQNADGDLVCVVQGKDYSQVVGEILLSFNGDTLSSCEGRPHLLLGQTFSKDGQPLTPEQLKQVEKFVEHSSVLSFVEPDEAANTRLQYYSEQVKLLAEQKVATIPERLCRIAPGRLREGSCGDNLFSDLHHLVSHAFLTQSKQADLALQNAGGVRSDLPAGEFSIAQAYQLLPFSNTLINLKMTGEEIKQVLEDAIAYTLTPGGSDGAYPEGAGIQFDVDLTQQDNQRVSNVTIQNRHTGEWHALQPQQQYIVVTNSFIASGLDGWTTFGKVSSDGRAEDTYLSYSQAFVDFARQQQVLYRPATNTHSTRNIILRP